MPRQKHSVESVNLVKQVRVGTRWKLATVVERNGKIVRDYVRVQGAEEHHPEGQYFLEWYESGKRRRKSVGAYDSAIEQAQLKSLELKARAAGILPAAERLAEGEPRLSLSAGIDNYLKLVHEQRSPRTFMTYRYTLDVLLRGSYQKKYIDEAVREDILAFISHCYQSGLGARTVYDKLVVVLQFFKRHGKTRLIEKGDWPEYVEKIRPIYEPEEIEVLLRHAEAEEQVFLKFLLTSGFRDREVRFLIWRDVDFRNSTVRVTAKARWGFKPKNKEERAVPLPSAMIEELRKLRERQSGAPADLVFPNSVGNPDSENDMIVKRVAERAQLNCGQCVTRHGNQCAKGPYCQHFFLHKFRHTFATEHLRHGIDIRTLQTWMGHRDIQSTMVYLKGVQSEAALIKVNAGVLATYAAQPLHLGNSA